MEYLLISEKFYGPMSAEQANLYSSEAKCSIFECGRCSRNGVAVYHNIIGRHCHLAPEQDPLELTKPPGKKTLTNIPD